LQIISTNNKNASTTNRRSSRATIIRTTKTNSQQHTNKTTNNYDTLDLEGGSERPIVFCSGDVWNAPETAPLVIDRTLFIVFVFDDSKNYYVYI
jgi:hypothetical protein